MLLGCCTGYIKCSKSILIIFASCGKHRIKCHKYTQTHTIPRESIPHRLRLCRQKLFPIRATHNLLRWAVEYPSGGRTNKTFTIVRNMNNNTHSNKSHIYLKIFISLRAAARSASLFLLLAFRFLFLLLHLFLLFRLSLLFLVSISSFPHPSLALLNLLFRLSSVIRSDPISRTIAIY